MIESATMKKKKRRGTEKGARICFLLVIETGCAASFSFFLFFVVTIWIAVFFFFFLWTATQCALYFDGMLVCIERTDARWAVVFFFFLLIVVMGLFS